MGFTLDMCSESHMIAYDTAETLGEKLNKTLDAVGSHTVKFALIVMPKRDAKTYRQLFFQLCVFGESHSKSHMLQRL